jgi:luciferase family oxidoreductase group 1
LNEKYTTRAGADTEDGSVRPIALGVLDLCKATRGATPRESIDHILEAAQNCEALGYKRYWLAEHHTSDAALSCPEILIPLIAHRATHIRIGLGGLLLAYQSVRRVAELAFALAAITQGRFDFGVCRGPGVAHSVVAAELALGGKDELTRENFRAKVRALLPYLLREPRPPGSTTLAPVNVPAPDFWLLGSSVETFDLAVETRAQLALSVLPGGRGFRDSAILSEYDAWRKVHPRVRPVLALSVVCMESQTQAEEHDRKLVRDGLLGSNVVGDPDCRAEEILWLSARYDVKELLVASWVARPADRLHCYELLATKLLAGARTGVVEA